MTENDEVHISESTLSCSSVFQGVVGFGSPAVDKICLLKLSLWISKQKCERLTTFSHKKMQFLVTSHQGQVKRDIIIWLFLAFLPSCRHYGAPCGSTENIGEQKQLYLLCWKHSWKEEKDIFRRSVRKHEASGCCLWTFCKSSSIAVTQEPSIKSGHSPWQEIRWWALGGQGPRWCFCFFKNLFKPLAKC